jgi:PAS domain S-box-containing protein
MSNATHINSEFVALQQKLARLERENELLRTALDESPDVVVLKDAKGDFLLCNRTVAALYGTTPEAMIGKSDGHFSATPEQDAFFRDNVMGIMRSGVTQIVMEESTDDRTGKVRYFKSIKKPFKNKDGENCILVIAHDISDIRAAQARVEASERQLSLAMQATGEGLWDWRIDTGELRHNNRWYEILGYSVDDLTGTVKDFTSLLHPDEKDEVERLLQDSLEHGQHYHHEHRMRHRNGDWIWVLDRGEVVERTSEGRPLRMVGSFSNIQQRKQVEIDLVEAKHQAELANKAKSIFLANMSHEIRTPMNGVVGMLSLLEASGLNQEQTEQAHMIKQSADALTQLIDEILDLSKIEAGKMALRNELVHLHDLINSCTQLHAAGAQAKGLQVNTKLAPGLPSILLIDPYRLRQIINNLLNNAIKFTRQGQIQLSASCHEGYWQCEVQDSGIGISEAQQALLFKPFSQVDDSSTRHHGGTGLGLSISKRLIEAMGGEIGVKSSVGNGSCFWFRLPLNKDLYPPDDRQPRNKLTQSEQNNQADLIFKQGPSVLVAEDHPLNQKMILSMLEKLGASHQLVDNGLATLQILRERHFDIVLMDCQMPIMDGYEAVRRIRAGEAGEQAAQTPILALTANAMPEDVFRCKQAGFNMHVPKPITLEALCSAITQWTKVTGAQGHL